MLWSGSRWLNVYVDTITIMYGLDGRRHFLKTRALSFALYLVMLVVSIVLLPVLVVGPEVLGRIFPAASGFIEVAYWPVVVAASVSFLTSLYHVSVPVRTPWRRDLPGAAVALVIWIVGSVLLRIYLDTSVDSTSAYGSLAAPIAVLFWLYVTALAVLIGAGLNAVVDKLWPFVPTARARRQAAERRAGPASAVRPSAAARSAARTRGAGGRDGRRSGGKPGDRGPWPRLTSPGVVTLADLGWDEAWAAALPEGARPGRVLRAERGAYVVLSEAGEEVVGATGAGDATTGDWLGVHDTPDGPHASLAPQAYVRPACAGVRARPRNSSSRRTSTSWDSSSRWRRHRTSVGSSGWSPSPGRAVPSPSSS